MTARERAEQIVPDSMLTISGMRTTVLNIRRDITSALEVARDEALEEAAECARDELHHVAQASGSQFIEDMAEQVPDRIRSLKSKKGEA